MTSRDGCGEGQARQYLGGTGGMDWEGWSVTIEWATDDDGRAVPVGLTLSGYSGSPEDGTLTGPLRTLSREVTKRLPLGELIDRSREAMVRDGGSGLPWVRSDTYSTATPTTHVERLARAALIHAEEVAAGNRAPSQATLARLAREGVTSGHGQPLTDTRVRTWIAEAKKRGLYPGEKGNR